MKKINPFNSMLLSAVCVAMLSTTTWAQQPFEPLPNSGDEAAPADAVDQDQDRPLLVRPSDNPLPQQPFTAPKDRERVQDQTVVVNTRFAGWEEAGLDRGANRLGNQIRGNWIMVDSNGRFDGTVIPGGDAEVENMNIFLLNMGRLVKQTRVDANGQFEFNNVRQGAYSLIGWGPNGIFAFGMNILDHNPNAEGAIQNTVVATAYQNKTTINTDWIRYYSPGVKFRVFGRYPTGEGRDDPPALYGFQGQQAFLPTAVLANSISSEDVRSTPDGRLIGRVHQSNSLSGRPVDVRSTKVMLFEGDDVVAVTTTDNYGVFEFQQVPTGTYGLTAVGVDGVGMITINVVNDDSAGPNAEAAIDNPSVIDFTMISAETVGWLNNYATEVAYARSLKGPRPKTNEEENVCPACNNQGCSHCQQQLQKFCDSRCITFDQWNSSCFKPGVNYGYGNGTIAAANVRLWRLWIGRSDRIYDRAFYPGEYTGEYANQQYYYGFGNQPTNPYNQQQQQYMGSDY